MKIKNIVICALISFCCSSLTALTEAKTFTQEEAEEIAIQKMKFTPEEYALIVKTYCTDVEYVLSTGDFSQMPASFPVSMLEKLKLQREYLLKIAQKALANIEF